MDGTVANLQGVCDLADKYEALVMVDDSHATGFMGKTGRGSIEHRDVMGRVDVIMSTLGKAMGGASGGFTSGRKEIIEICANAVGPIFFSNTVAPAIVAVGAAIEAFDMLERKHWITRQTAVEHPLLPQGNDRGWLRHQAGDHPIVPIMLGEARLAATMADQLLDEGIYVIGFSYPVVPKGQARIRVQLSAAHDQSHLDKAIAAFTKVGKSLGVISE